VQQLREYEHAKGPSSEFNDIYFYKDAMSISTKEVSIMKRIGGIVI